MAKVRVYLGCSVDGYIAGENDDLSWLDRPGPEDAPPDSGSLEFADFMSQVGVLLMGRRTHDVITAMDVPWPYGDTPVLVATRRPLTPAVPTIRAVSGSIEHVVDEARTAAGERDVYLDGGDLVRQALAAGLVDEMTLSMLPVVLGGGVRLFGELAHPVDFRFTAHHWCGYGGAVQVTLARR